MRCDKIKMSNGDEYKEVEITNWNGFGKTPGFFTIRKYNGFSRKRIPSNKVISIDEDIFPEGISIKEC